MTLESLFSSLLSWLIGFLLGAPILILKLLGGLMPPCSEMGWTALPSSVVQSMTNMARFLWPLLQFVPWTFVWNYLSAWILFLFFMWLVKNIMKLLSLGLTFWIVVAIIWVVLGSVNWLIGTSWQDSSVFQDVFGTSATGTVGGGGGGGGGGSW
jgi:hypothetical protein